MDDDPEARSNLTTAVENRTSAAGTQTTADTDLAPPPLPTSVPAQPSQASQPPAARNEAESICRRPAELPEAHASPNPGRKAAREGEVATMHERFKARIQLGIEVREDLRSRGVASEQECDDNLRSLAELEESAESQRASTFDGTARASRSKSRGTDKPNEGSA